MSIATDMRDKYLAAETAILLGQSSEFNGRKLTMADLATIRAGRLEWERRAQAEANATSGASSPRFSAANFNDVEDRRLYPDGCGWAP